MTSSTSKVLLGEISHGLSIFNVKMNLSKIFRNYLNGRHSEVRRTFEPKVVPEVEFYIEICNAIAYVWSVCSMV